MTTTALLANFAITAQDEAGWLTESSAPSADSFEQFLERQTFSQAPLVMQRNDGAFIARRTTSECRAAFDAMDVVF